MDVVFVISLAAFAVVYGGGYIWMRVTNSWSRVRYSVIATISALPLLADMLWSIAPRWDLVWFAIIVWPSLVFFLLFMPYGLRQRPPEVRGDDELRWDLRDTRK